MGKIPPEILPFLRAGERQARRSASRCRRLFAELRFDAVACVDANSFGNAFDGFQNQVVRAIVAEAQNAEALDVDLLVQTFDALQKRFVKRAFAFLL